MIEQLFTVFWVNSRSFSIQIQGEKFLFLEIQYCELIYNSTFFKILYLGFEFCDEFFKKIVSFGFV